ncbi:MAG: hypothetical protein RIT43_405 [Bacteroidota bacterium]|jgi:hypothetical protein
MDTTETHKMNDSELLLYLEMGDLSAAQGRNQEALDFYIKGLHKAKEQQDKARIQQFSNLIYTYL